MTIIVRSPDVKPGARSLAAQPGDEASLGLFVSGVNCPDLHSPTHEAQQPVITAHTVVLEMQVQRLVPAERGGAVTDRVRTALYSWDTRLMLLMKRRRSFSGTV